MKKNYKTPTMKVTALNMEGLICGSLGINKGTTTDNPAWAKEDADLEDLNNIDEILSGWEE